MNARIVLFILGLVSSILYWTAPVTYSLTNCYICLGIFFVAFYILFKERIRNNLICFEFIFSFSFLYTNYLYPTFLYNINASFSLFGLEFPENYIDRGIALTTVGYVFLTLGLLKYPCIAYLANERKRNQFKELAFYKPAAVLLLLLLIVSLIPVLQSGIYDGNYGEGAFYKVVADVFIYYLIFETFSNSKSFKGLIKKNTLFFALVLSYVVLMTLIGNRGMFMRIRVITLFCYNYFVKRIKVKHFVIMLVFGMALMTFVGQERGGGSGRSEANREIPTVLLLGKDLIINNRSLYVLMDYGDRYGFTFGRTSGLDFLAVIPFGQSLFMKFTGLSEGELNSATLVTDLFYQGNDDNRIGLGTNLIGDIYISFGFFGVVFLMYFLGVFISRLHYKGMRGDMLSLFIYAIFTMTAIIYVRSPYFSMLRPVIWSIAFYYIANSKKKSPILKNREYPNKIDEKTVYLT